ncbi:MAG: glycoside hydrolase family 2 TIM barrel-domain containing protein [Waltera sp.]
MRFGHLIIRTMNFLDLCDEQGILVWEESHARGLKEYHMQNPYFQKQSEDCIREMVMNHKNHPRIFVWGILNECASETLYGRGLLYKTIQAVERT